jgi:hypothetical protein
MDFIKIHHNCKEQNITGRYVHLEHIMPLLLNSKRENLVREIGKSVQEDPIFSYTIGVGKKKILMWSQMHGNESTTTKALFDLFNFFEDSTELSTNLLQNFTICFVPILNPDGAKMYTRENANGVDLNRDAQDLSQPESIVLRNLYNDFKPDYCFNLHDQRTIYGVGDSDKSAVVSFLAPSFDEERSINSTRHAAIDIIVAMNNVLQQYIPSHVGRYDDSFNANCVGDTFQFLGTPTVLFESGHYPDDYEREQTRKYIFIALLASLKHIYENVVVFNGIQDYLHIPQNKTSFFDIIYKNVTIDYDNTKITTNFAIQFNEELLNNNIFFNAFIAKIEKLENCFGHKTIDANFKTYSSNNNKQPVIDQKADFFLDRVKIKNGVVVDA